MYNLGAAAIKYAERGWSVFPLIAETKKPTKGSHGFYDATNDPTTVKQWWDEDNRYNIGLRCSRLLVLDMDGEDGRAAIAALEAVHGKLPETLRQRTGRDNGGIHHIFRVAEDIEIPPSAGRLGPHLDIRGSTSYIVVAPSIHPDTKNEYRWDTPDGEPSVPIAECPAWLIELARPSEPKPMGRAFRAIQDGVELFPEGQRHDAMMREAGRIARFHRGAPELVVMTMQHINDTRCDPPLPDEELDKIVAAALAYAEADVQPPDIRIVPETKKGVHLVEEPEPEDQSTAVAVTKVGSLTKDEIIALLRCSTKTRKPFPNFYNAVVLLRHDPAWCNSVYYNLFSNDLMFSRDVPRLRARAGDKVIDTHINTLAYELQADSQAEFRHDMVMNALLLVGNERAIHPVREYLKGLQWDGTARIDTWLIDHLGAQDTELTRVFSARWLLSAVGRVRVPGCEAQCCLILEGGEGIRKSRSIRALCPDPAWFTDSVGDFLNKDTWLALHGKWLVEFGELTSLRRSEVEEAKTFIGRNTDRFRAPYGRIPQDWPRQFVFAGTTNRDDYLIEANGNRRFWPVHVTGSEEGALAAVRDQLWAEAAHRYNAGEEWWLHEPRLIEEAKHLVEARESQHPWLDTITTVVSRKQVGAHIDIGTILSETIGKDLKNQTTADAMQVGRILKKLGLERVQVRVGPTRHWTYRKVK